MKYIIFDLDGTLIDSMPVWRGTGSGFLKNHNFPVPENLMEVVKTQTIWQTAEWFRTELGVPMEAEDIVNEIVESVVEAYRHTIPLKDGAMEYLEKMKNKGVEMCILTASEADYILPALDRLDIRKYFSHVLTCTELGEYKNDGKAYLKTMELMGGTLEETVVFEDAYYAVKGAKSVGFPVYAVLDEVVREDDIDKIKETADHYFHSYKELL
ncbi:MAG: HAD family phosphatase [Anaerotignum sp.]|nr:HAD family phosphatase [Anaerotignum sp.]MBR5793108.1 HAD family phosphatase [Anaerotignum sp.]